VGGTDLPSGNALGLPDIFSFPDATEQNGVGIAEALVKPLTHSLVAISINA